MSYLINCYKKTDVTFVKGEGSYLYDNKNKKYIDFGSGISVVNLGHCNKRVTEKLILQANRLWHTSNLYNIEIQEELAGLIAKNSFDSKVFFCNSGAEANEGAIKLARIYGNKKYDGLRYKIVTFENSFHGRTYATLSATGQEKVKKGFEPVADYFKTIKPNDFEGFKRLTEKGDIVAVMLELIQGEGGVEAMERGFVKCLTEYCRDNDILVIFDEIQTGMGRTGEMFAFQHFQVEPDIMTLAKALGNGFPIGAVVAKPTVAEYLSYGTHGSTFGGNFLACAVGVAVFEQMTEEGFLQRVREKGGYLQTKLRKIFDQKASILGQGLMIGIRLNQIDINDFISECLNKGLVLVPAANNTIRVYPPLTVSYEEMDCAVSIIEDVLKKLEEEN